VREPETGLLRSRADPLDSHARGGDVESALDARIREVLRTEMARVRARLAALSGRDPAERPRPPAVLRLPAAEGAPKDGIFVAPGWGEPPDLVADWYRAELRPRLRFRPAR
jgi:hypothetical protein